jgi:hypothetical protein
MAPRIEMQVRDVRALGKGDILVLVFLTGPGAGASAIIVILDMTTVCVGGREGAGCRIELLEWQLHVRSAGQALPASSQSPLPTS